MTCFVRDSAADAQSALFAPRESAKAWSKILGTVIGEARDLAVAGSALPLDSDVRSATH